MNFKYLTAAFLILIIAILSMATGCESAEVIRDRWARAIDKTEETASAINITAEQLLEAIAASEAQIAVLPDGDVKNQIIAGVTNAKNELERIVAKRDGLNEAVENARAKLASIDQNADGASVSLIMAGEAVGSVGAMAPGPIGIYAGLAGSILGGLGTMIQSFRRRKSANEATDMMVKANNADDARARAGDVIRNIVTSIETAKSTEAGAVAWKAHFAPVLNKGQSNEAMAAIRHIKTGT